MTMTTPERLSIETVKEIAALHGLSIDDETALRIADGGAAASDAVRAACAATPIGTPAAVEPADYLPTLETLARHTAETTKASSPARSAGAISHDAPITTAIDPCDLDLCAVTEGLVSGQRRSRDLVRAALARAEWAQSRTNCFLRLETELALQAAELADAMLEDARRAGRAPVGPLLGVPLAHKDMFDRRGHASSFGSQALEPLVAATTATVLQRLEFAGAISLGTLNMAEFALGATGHNVAWGDCRNVWDPAFISGGSSSGSGAAVASGAAFASLGSDTGGSVRIPASVQGVFGLKPTYGLLPRSGSMPLAPSIDVLGPITRSVRDLARVLQVVAGGDGEDPQCSLRPIPDYADALGRGVTGWRIGIPRQYFLDRLEPPVRTAYERALAVFEAEGATLVEVEVPHAALLAELSRAIVYPEALAVHAEALRTRGSKYSPQTRVRASTGLAISGTHYLEALRRRMPILTQFVSVVFGDCDLLVTPTLPIRVPRRDETDVGSKAALWAILKDLVRCTAPFNYLGLPALSVPAGLDDRGLPMGVQLVGAPFDEPRLLAAAAVHERVVPPPSVANWPRK